MNPLTQQQKAVLKYLTSFIRKNGYPPTRQEIADEMGFASANGAQAHLKALARKGRIALTLGVFRGIKVRGR